MTRQQKRVKGFTKERRAYVYTACVGRNTFATVYTCVDDGDACTGVVPALQAQETQSSRGSGSAYIFSFFFSGPDGWHVRRLRRSAFAAFAYETRLFAREWLYARVSLLTTPNIADTTPTTRRRAGTTDELISAASGVGPSWRNVRGAPAITFFATSGLPVRDGGDAGYPRATSTSATTPRGRASKKSRYSDRSGVLFRGRMQIGSLALYYEMPP